MFCSQTFSGNTVFVNFPSVTFNTLAGPEYTSRCQRRKRWYVSTGYHFLSHEAHVHTQNTSSRPSAALGSSNSPRAESPTTARPMDFDDEPQENGIITSDPIATQPAAAEAAPPKPPRPLNPREQSENTLREAFPSIEPGVIKAVLTASNWNVEPAFNALLGSWGIY